MVKEKTRNGGQWTDGRFKSFITSALRSATRRWPPKWATLNEAFVGIRKNRKTKRDSKHYRCSGCRDLYPAKEVQIDHIIPIGRDLDWNSFIEALFCEKDNLQ